MNADHQNFIDGLVFGFDVGTGSIGYAVRRGTEFLDVGVLICDSDGSDLSKRRDLRRQRRTLRSKKYRRQWFDKELVKLGLPKPEVPPNDPITLRLRALNGEEMKPEELHAALTNLFKRRGYSRVPWANIEKAAKETTKPKKDDEEGVIKKAVEEIKAKLGDKHPCQFLAERREKAGKSPTEHWARKIYWPREVLQKEFEAIAEAQKKNFPQLAEKTEWLLYGDSQPKKKGAEIFHVFFKTTEARNPGVLGLRWPRFDNRGPALDSLQPVDEQGRPLHVVRKNKQAFTNAQWELALMNFRVLDVETRQKRDPRTDFPVFIENVRNEWNKKGKVTEARLKKLAEPFKDRFLLIEDQKPLAPETGAGRARYSSPTLELIRKEIGSGRRVDPPQPILRRQGENAEQALNRYLADIKHPLVRHRLVLFRRLLMQLASRHGQPDMIVLEAVRSLALGQKAKNELNKRNEQFRKEREIARSDLTAVGKSTSRKAITRYRLWKEAQSTCPFCGEKITQEQIHNGLADIEHLVPRAIVDCNEFYNLTVAHIECNRELKKERTPFVAFAHTPEWAKLKTNAERCFTGRKLEIFLSPNAEELIEQKTDLPHTAYIARVIRHISLIQLGWLNAEGRDPTPEKQNSALGFQVTNGQLTSRLRKAWGLNQILHPLPSGKRWDELADEEQKQFTEKNRGDLRHHALDAMVIACTLPWLAHRTYGATDGLGRHGWWTQDEKQRSKAANPLFPNEGQMHEVVKGEIEKVVVRHHVSRSNHQQSYATTLYAKKAKDTYVAREVFTSLTPKNLGSIWPKEFAYYCEAAWRRYADESPDIDGELKQTKNCVPETFTRKLCFSHFQKWRQEDCPEFYWPHEVKIPIRNVRLISVKDDTAVVPFSPGTHAFVKRTGFKEVQIFLADDEKSFVPVFIPYWKGDKVVCETPIKQNRNPVAIIRRGMVVETKKAFSTGQLPGKYRVLTTAQVQLKLLPHHVANKEEAIISFGLGKKVCNPCGRILYAFLAMSYHILHLLSHNLRVRLKLDQLHITDTEKGTERTVPLADVAVIVAAAPDMSITAGALRRMAELNVLLIVCNEKFEPCAIALPYYRPTNTELLRRQIEWTPEWKTAMWRQIITAKVRNQAANLAHLKRAHMVLTEIANRCEKPNTVAASRQSAADEEVRRSPEAPLRPSLATLTASKRAAFLSDSPDASESRAARHYWKHLLPRLSEWQKTDEKRRTPGTREGVNGMLDYGYAIMRTAVLRSLAAHGFIAAIGIAHAPKAGSFALADDLMEPLRPWIDQELRLFLQGGERPMQEWMRQAVTVLQADIKIGQTKMRLLNAVDVYVRSFAEAALARAPFPLKMPMLP